MMFLRNLRSGSGAYDPKNVWKKIIQDHPLLLDLFLPGNEDRLQKARQQLPRLDDAIKNFGMPSDALIQEIAGSNGDGELNPNATFTHT